MRAGMRGARGGRRKGCGTSGRGMSRGIGQRDDLHAPARSCAGRHEEGGLMVRGRDRGTFGLIFACASRRCLSAGRVFMERLG